MTAIYLSFTPFIYHLKEGLQKVKKTSPPGNGVECHFDSIVPMHFSVILGEMFFMFAVARIPAGWTGPLNGKHKLTFLCALCGSAVNKKI